MKSERIAYWDYLRGIAILMVVAIHCYPFNPKVLDGNVLPSAMRAFINVCVPLFLAISGFFIGKKRLNTKDDYFSFLKRQIPRVYIPCILFSIPITLLTIYKGGSILGSLVKLVLCQSFVIYYFIALIIQFYVLTPLIHRVISKPFIGGGTILILNIASLFVLQYILTDEFNYRLFLFRVGPFIYWITYYALGIYLSSSKRNYSLITPFMIMITGYLVQFAETYFFDIGIDLPVSIVIYSCGMILLLFSIRTERFFNKISKYLEWLASFGRYSFLIYLIHLYVKMGFTHFVHTKDWFICWICISIFSFFATRLIDKIITQKTIKKYLGLN